MQTESSNNPQSTDAYLEFAKLAKQYLRPPGTNQIKANTYQRFNKKQILNFLNHPQHHQKQLRDASIYLYNMSPHYRRLINYYSKMSTFDYFLSPTKTYSNVNINQKSFIKAYKNASEQCELMNLKHELIKIVNTCFLEDAFYGYEFQSKDSYFIQKLNPDYCRIVAIEDGIYTFEFNFSFFDTRPDMLECYGSEFKKKYELYQADRSGHKWQELNSKTAVCIKLNEDLPYSVPPFAGVFPDIFDISDYKQLMKQRTETGNYQLLTMKIPYENGDFKIPLPLATSFYDQIAPQIPSGIGWGLTPMDIDAVTFDQSGSTQDVDAVTQSQNRVWEAAGVSNAILGNPDVTSSSALTLSIETDAGLVYGLLRQIERWINKKLKQLTGVYHFKISFLNTTIYNRESRQKQLLSACQYSFPLRYATAASFGLSPADFEGMLVFENQMMNLQEQMTPVSSTHTQSAANSEAGRPKQETTDEAGEQTEVNSENDR